MKQFYYRKFESILNFLSNYDKLLKHKCVEISPEQSEIEMDEKCTRTQILNVKINNKVMKILHKTGKIADFLSIFDDFYNVSIQLIIKESHTIFDEVNKFIDDLQDVKNIYNIELMIKKSTVNEEEFASNNNISLVIFSPLAKIIDKHAFLNCHSLRNIIISDSVNEIRVAAFKNCTSLKEVDIPNSVNALLEFAFNGCTAIEKVTLSSSIELIRVGTFENCSSLKDIVVPNSITKIMQYAFKNCTSLKTFNFTDSIQRIEPSAFDNCPSSENIPDNLKIIKNTNKCRRGRRNKKETKDTKELSSDNDDDSFS